MSTRASQHRYVVTEALVTMLKGNIKNIEDVVKKLVEVLTVVLLFLYRDQNIHQPC